MQDEISPMAALKRVAGELGKFLRRPNLERPFSAKAVIQIDHLDLV